jgi:hypothetical protein
VQLEQVQFFFLNFTFRIILFLRFSNDDYRKVYSLVTHTSTRDPDNLFQRAVIAKFLVDLLQNSNYFEDNNSLDAKK